MNHAIILAAGSSVRMNGLNKTLVEVLGYPALYWTLVAFERHPQISDMVLVGKKEDQKKLEELVDKFKLKKIAVLVTGGTLRQDSVYNGILAGKRLGWKKEDFVFIQDGARILVSKKEIDAALKFLTHYEAVVVAVPVKDTIHRVNQEGLVVETPLRETLWQAQTPQVVRFDLALSSFQKTQKEKRVFTDDVSLAKYYHPRLKVKKTLGSFENLKITTPEDVTIVENILRGRQNDPKTKD